MNKRTPGPWIFDEIDEVGHFDVYNSSKSTLICTGAGFYGDAPQSESESNARLIASAPELLEALEACVQYLNVAFNSEGDCFGVHHNGATDAVQAAEVAIAKAKGEA